jgi:hypothetical protein
MKRLFLVIVWGLPGIALAQTTPPHGVGLGNYKLKMSKPDSRKQVNEAAIRKDARQQLAPDSYESRPHSMRITVPDSTTSRMPRAATPNNEGPGGVAPLLQQELRKKRP